MKAAYLKAPFEFELRDVSLRELRDDEVLVKVKACGYCGHDNILAKYAAKEWEPFGHEFSGVIERVGKGAKGLCVGDRVVVMTSSFDPLADCSRDGRVDFSCNGPSFMELKDASMGFAEYAIVPYELCVVFEGLEFSEASVIEPLGVAVDLVKTADIRLNDDVLILGLGPIGLMALQMAKASGARKIYAAEFSGNKKRCELAKQFGADELIYTDQIKLEEYAFEKGGVNKVMVTAPPATITNAVNVCRIGGIVAFLGISYGPDAVVSFDSNKVHLDKLQIRGSNAIPALYFPMCIDLLKAGHVDTKSLITHTFPLEETVEGLKNYLSDNENAVKAVMIAE